LRGRRLNLGSGDVLSPSRPERYRRRRRRRVEPAACDRDSRSTDERAASRCERRDRRRVGIRRRRRIGVPIGVRSRARPTGCCDRHVDGGGSCRSSRDHCVRGERGYRLTPARLQSGQRPPCKASADDLDGSAALAGTSARRASPLTVGVRPRFLVRDRDSKFTRNTTSS
jgi:hypothetical protein